jgi:hypothetical protein
LRALKCCFLFAIAWFSIATPSKAQGSDSLFVMAKTRTKDNGKIIFSQWKPFATQTVSQLINLNNAKPYSTNKYGSKNNLKFKETGFFRTEKLNEKWWSVDPEGFGGLHVAVNSVQQGKSVNNQQSFKSLFGGNQIWMNATAQIILDNGFNGTGSWCDTDEIIQYNKTSPKPLAYSVMLNFMSEYGNKRGGTRQEAGHKGYPNNAIFVFDAAFEIFCDELASKLVKYKNDKNLYGYFTDNELPFSLKNLQSYLSLPKTDEGYIAAMDWMQKRGLSPSKITNKDEADFLGFVADKYFSIVIKSIRKYDPNHLCLGSRFYSGEKNVRQFMQAAGKYIDVVSVNYYGTWTPSQKSMQDWERWSGKPLIITEFYVKAEDSGLANQSGAGWIVKTQNDRGLFYQNYCIGLLKSNSCIGWHWFKYQDNDPTYTKADPSNNDANKGIVNNDYKPYQPLLNQMKELNDNKYHLIDHFKKFMNEIK